MDDRGRHRLDAQSTAIAVTFDMPMVPTPKALHSIARGSRPCRVPRVMWDTAIWLPQRGWTIARRSWRCSCCTNDRHAAYRVCKTPLGFRIRAAWCTQGAPLARRPWALECNAFGVKTIDGVIGGCVPMDRSGKCPFGCPINRHRGNDRYGTWHLRRRRYIP